MLTQNLDGHYVQTTIKEFLLTKERDFSPVQQEYFRSPPTGVYKEGKQYPNRRKIQFTLLEEFGVKINDHQSATNTLMVGSTDRMSINAPSEIPITPKKVYAQDWEAYNQAQTQEKILFMELLNELTSNIPPQKYKGNGRPPAKIGEMIFSICLKTYLDFSSRRTESDIQMAQQLGYIEHVPHFNTILKYLNTPALTQVFKELIIISALPLKQVEENFTVDASGFSTSLFERWVDVREKRAERRLFKKSTFILRSKNQYYNKCRSH